MEKLVQTVSWRQDTATTWESSPSWIIGWTQLLVSRTGVVDVLFWDSLSIYIYMICCWHVTCRSLDITNVYCTQYYIYIYVIIYSHLISLVYTYCVWRDRLKAQPIIKLSDNSDVVCTSTSGQHLLAVSKFQIPSTLMIQLTETHQPNRSMVWTIETPSPRFVLVLSIHLERYCWY